MKILYHHRTLSKDGMDVHITELVKALRGRGHEVVLVGPEASPDFGSGDGGLSRLRAMLPRPISELLELAYDILAYRRLKQAYLEHRPDILYERYNLYLLAGRRLKRRYKIPLILEVNAPLVHERRIHGGLALGRLAKWCEESVWRAADAVLPVSTPLAQFVLDANVPRDRVTLVQNGVDTERFNPQIIGDAVRAELGLDGKLVLGFAGFVRPWHGVDRVLRFLAESGPAKAHLLVVGDGPAREGLEALAAEFGIEDRLTFTGVVERDKIADYVAAFDIALQPSAVSYASPLKLFEYMALGKAIIAPDQVNIREIVSDGESALLFGPEQPNSFVEKLAELCSDDSLRTRLGIGAAKTITEREFTWAGNASKIEAVAENLFAERRL